MLPFPRHKWPLTLLTGLLLLTSGYSHGEEGPGGAPSDWPESIVARVGDLEVRLESRSFWTLYRIDLRGKRVCMDQWGSHYGSVARFPNVGFIGSGHTENEDEVVLTVSLQVDGKPMPSPPETLECTTLRLEKRSRIRTLVLDTVVEVRQGNIMESVSLQADVDTPVSLIYHFMHPWVPSMTHFLGERIDGTRVDGHFNDDKAMEIDAPTRWSAVYDENQEIGAVTAVVTAPEDHWRTRYWDVPKRYRKHYFTTFQEQVIPAGKTFTYQILTTPFQASPATWEEVVLRVVDGSPPPG